MQQTENKIEKKLSDFGGSIQEDNSKAFAAAMSFFAQNNGGTLIIEKGIWKTGPISLCSNINIIFEEGAIISFIPTPELYRPVKTRWEGVVCYGMHPCFFATNVENISISGKGIIDGNGEIWWNLLAEKKKQGKPVTDLEKELARLNPGYETQPGGGGGRNTQFLRPSLMQFFECKNVTVKDITLRNSPFWTFHPVFTDGLTVENIFVTNPHDAPNTDGIDIDSCTNVTIDSCSISVGDDGIAIKSGSGSDGIQINKPSKNIKITNCRVGNGHGGVVIGSETAAGIENVDVENCFFDGTDRGIRIKTRRGRGGKVTNLKFKDLLMVNNLCPFAVNMYYACGTNRCEPEFFSLDALPVKDDTPSVSNVEISGVKATGCKASAGFIAAIPEQPLTNLKITNCEFETNETATETPDLSDMFAGLPEVNTKSFRIINADNPIFENVKISGPKEAFIFN